MARNLKLEWHDEFDWQNSTSLQEILLADFQHFLNVHAANIQLARRGLILRYGLDILQEFVLFN